MMKIVIEISTIIDSKQFTKFESDLYKDISLMMIVPKEQSKTICDFYLLSSSNILWQLKEYKWIWISEHLRYEI